MMMGSVPSGGWLMDYMDEIQATGLLWPQILSDETVSSNDLGHGMAPRGEDLFENSCSKKRGQVKSCATTGSKACREKMRRDKLNDRFLELCSILEPGRLPKTDKIGVLTDATRLLSHLRHEAQKLKETNEALQDTIKNLKAEKMELREEKVKLKAEKEKMERTVKAMSMPSPFIPHPVYHAFGNGFAANNKAIPYHMNYLPPTTMWQWIPPASLDTSLDHILRPPVA